MISLERELQRNLAIVLVLVMLAIWSVGLFIPKNGSVPFYHVVSDVNESMPDTTNTAYHRDNKASASDYGSYGSKRRFAWLFPILAGVGVIITLLLQGVVIRRSFRRLDQIQLELKQLEQGQILRLSDNVPQELQPLTQAFNHILALMQERMERSRHSLGNLAHALKGPISLLQQTLGRPTLDKQQAQQQLERLRQLTERELKRARMAGLGNTTQRFRPTEDLQDLIHVLLQIHQKPTTFIQLEIEDVESINDREDMLELLGNLLDNACKWGKNTVRLRLYSSEQQLFIQIEDDGAGLTADELHHMTKRGTRLDESVAGHGLGLAICKDIIKLYNGNMTFSHSQTLGGLRVDIVI